MYPFHACNSSRKTNSGSQKQQSDKKEFGVTSSGFYNDKIVDIVENSNYGFTTDDRTSVQFDEGSDIGLNNVTDDGVGVGVHNGVDDKTDSDSDFGVCVNINDREGDKGNLEVGVMVDTGKFVQFHVGVEVEADDGTHVNTTTTSSIKPGNGIIGSGPGVDVRFVGTSNVESNVAVCVGFGDGVSDWINDKGGPKTHGDLPFGIQVGTGNCDPNHVGLGVETSAITQKNSGGKASNKSIDKFRENNVDNSDGGGYEYGDEYGSSSGVGLDFGVGVNVGIRVPDCESLIAGTGAGTNTTDNEGDNTEPVNRCSGKTEDEVTIYKEDGSVSISTIFNCTNIESYGYVDGSNSKVMFEGNNNTSQREQKHSNKRKLISLGNQWLNKATYTSPQKTTKENIPRDKKEEVFETDMTNITERSNKMICHTHRNTRKQYDSGNNENTKKLKLLDKTYNSLVRGTTNIFISDGVAFKNSFKRIKISSKRIATATYPNVAGIQTLQFQQATRSLRGHSCMIHENKTWKLFFVWDASMVYYGYIFGYMYTGKLICVNDLITLPISTHSGDFYWVNLYEDNFPRNILPQLKFSVKIINDYYFGNHSPSTIELPVPDTKRIMNPSDRYVEPFKNVSNERSCHIKYLEDFCYYDVSLENTSYHMNSDMLQRKKHGQGKNRCCTIFQTKNLLNLPYLTIFQATNYNIPYKEYLEASDFLVAVPYSQSGNKLDKHPFCSVDYALIDSKNTNILHNLERKEYNKQLDRIKKFKFSLYQSTMNQPIRFCLVSENKLNDMIVHPKLYSWEALTTTNPKFKKHCCELKLVESVNDNTKFLYGITNLPNVMLPGVCVSMWRHSTDIPDISRDFTDAVEKSFGRGFGDRSCAPCLGVNAYFGHHYNKRVIDRPETIPGTRILDHYGRQTDKNQEAIPVCQKYIKRQAHHVLQITRTMNSNYMLFIGYNTCDRIIWTQGINQNGKRSNPNQHKNQQCISFANKLHIDKCDLVKKEPSDVWFNWVKKLKIEKCKGEHDGYAAQHVIDKFKEIETTFGIGLPTTCGYSHVVVEESDIVDINSSFIEMNFAMPITNKSIHHMYAWTFPHATALTIATTSDSKILVKSGTKSEHYVNVAAWGNSGGSKHAERRNMGMS